MNRVAKALLPIASQIPLAWERLESGVSLNLLSKSFHADPYPFYARLREKDPVHRMRTAPMWAISRYEDIQKVLRDHKRFSNHDKLAEPVQENGRELLSGSDASSDGSHHRVATLAELDPPDHTRLRSLVSRAFTPRAVSRLEGRIETLTEGLISGLGDVGRFDLISALAHSLPVTVIAEMIGVPSHDMDRFAKWSDVLALRHEPILDTSETAAIEQANREILAHLEGIMRERSREPKEDMITALLGVEEEGDRLSRTELLGILTLLLSAGIENTRNLICNGILALVNHPAQQQLLRDDPSLVGSAVNEILRYDGPGQFAVRTATEDVRIGGKEIPAGHQVVNLLGSANRDPSVFSEPDTFDITREGKPHLSFGYGIHRCLGAPLAVTVAPIVFGALLRRFRHISLAAPPKRRNRVILRGMKELWLEVG